MACDVIVILLAAVCFSGREAVAQLEVLQNASIVSNMVGYRSRRHNARNDTDHIIHSAKKIIDDTNALIEETAKLRLNSIRSIPFEVGYVMFNIQEEYRRMVDKYHTCYSMGGRLYLYEFMFYLEDVEYHFWKIEHLANMLHEVERKYGMKGDTLNDLYDDVDDHEGDPKRVKARTKKPTHKGPSDAEIPNEFTVPTPTKKKKRKNKFQQRDEDMLAKKSTLSKRNFTRWWWSDYGWEIDNPW